MNHKSSFLKYLKSLNYSDKTIETRENAINRFSKFTRKKVKNLTEKDILDFLSESNLSVNTQNTYLLSLRQYFKYLEEEFIIFSNPARNIQCRKINKIPEVLSQEETERLLSLIGELDTNVPLRHKAIFELIYSSGLRRSELLNVKLEDIDLDNQLVRILGKGNTERLVPFVQNAKDAIIAYLEKGRPKSDSPFLFLKPDGSQMSIYGLNSATQYIAEKTGIEFSCHTLRRSCATHLLNNGANPMMIAELLGHKTLATLSHYLKVSVKDLKEMHQNSRLSL